jgi:hypothetical protein
LILVYIFDFGENRRNKILERNCRSTPEDDRLAEGAEDLGPELDADRVLHVDAMGKH